ncbi:MAG: hypothetical protein U0992_21705 [Planctomycetaceae bacterium]
MLGKHGKCGATFFAAVTNRKVFTKRRRCGICLSTRTCDQDPQREISSRHIAAAEAIAGMDTSNENLRLCHCCYQVQPIDAFRRRSKVGAARMYQCRDCHNEAERTRTIEKRAKHRQSEMFKFITQVKNARSRRQVETVVAAMIAACPSIEELALHPAQHIEPFVKADVEARSTAFRLLSDSWNTLDACSGPRASELTDEELANCVARDRRTHPAAA